MDYSEGTPQTQNWFRRFERLKSERSTWDSIWQEIADYVFPRKGGIISKDYTPNNGRDAQLYDTTAKVSLERAVAGYMSWTTPKSQPWAEFTPVLAQRESDATKNWLRDCSKLAAEYIANSNFYSQRHEYLFDLWGFGTGCLFSQVTPAGKTRFEKIKMGSFVFECDPDGRANVLMRDMEFNAEQAKAKFGEKDLPKCVTDELASSDPTKKKFTFLHVVEPRDPKDRSAGGYPEGQGRKAFLSAYVEKESKQIVEMGGFDSFPFHIGRFQEWDAIDAGSNVWGYGPGFTLLPEARQLNFAQQMADIFTEKGVFPPLYVPDTFDTPKTGSRAVNYYPSGSGPEAVFTVPTSGHGEAWKIFFERLNFRVRNIHEICYLDMFQMFSMNAANNREMTAFEAAQLAGEKLNAINPAFDRDTTEVIEPMMIRLFEQWAEYNMLPAPPPEAIAAIQGGIAHVPNPTVTMTSRLALAIRKLTGQTHDTEIAKVMQLATVAPEVLDNVDLDYYARESARLGGCDPKLLKDPKVVEQIRQARAQQQQAMMAAQVAKDGSQAVKNVGGMEQVEKMMSAA